MSVVLAALMAAVAVYCALRLAIKRWRDEHHGPAVDLTHVLMGSVMVMMLLATIPVWLEGPIFAAFAGAFVWFMIKSVHTGAHIVSMRIGATCLAMLYMLPPLTASAHNMSGSDSMPTSAMGGGGAASLIGSVFLVAMLAVAADAVLETAGRTSTTRRHLSTLCEVSMAGVMGYMLATML